MVTASAMPGKEWGPSILSALIKAPLHGADQKE
jgi:hypothetical protein